MPRERETLEVDVLFVGAGPACLAGAYHLKTLLEARSKEGGSDEVSIAVLEKGPEVGSHALSGAILDPKSLQELMPEFENRGFPSEGKINEDHLYYFSRGAAHRIPFAPAQLRDRGLHVVSLEKLVRWMAGELEKREVEIFAGFPGAELIWEGSRVAGVRTRDQGLDKNGEPKSNFEPGVDIRAKVTILGEGPRGTLTKTLAQKTPDFHGINPQVYVTGVKEIWELPPEKSRPGTVIHSLGYPLPGNMFGGGFIYHMQNNLLALGFVVALEYTDPFTDPHYELQRYKTHPFVAALLEGAEIKNYGAKTIPEGGYYSIPKTYGDGFLIVGDSAGLLNSMRLKGIHLAIKSGMLAAETVVEALEAGDFSSRTLGQYREKVDRSWISRELYACRNFHQAYHGGLWSGLIHTGFQMLTGGRGLKDPWPAIEGHRNLKKLSELGRPPDAKPQRIKFDGKLTFDKLTDVYHSGTKHEEDQPCHLLIGDLDICRGRCREEYGNPCQYFCPAQVYEIEEGEEGGWNLKLNPSNCVHCKTCDIMDPYENITWVPPEGGGGPRYTNM